MVSRYRIASCSAGRISDVPLRYSRDALPEGISLQTRTLFERNPARDGSILVMRTTKTQRHKDFLISLCLCVFVVFIPVNRRQSAISVALLFEDDTARAIEPILRQAAAAE